MPDWTPQPFIHDAIVCLRAPQFVLSSPNGQLTRGAEGYYAADSRLISTLVLTVDGREPEPVDAQTVTAAEARFLAVHRGPDDLTPDPAVTVERLRRAHRELERITVTNRGRRPVHLRIALQAGSDLADVSAVKSGRTPCALPAVASGPGLSWTSAGIGAVTLTCDPAPDRVDPAATPAVLDWAVQLAPGQQWAVTAAVDFSPDPDSPPPAVAVVSDRVPWSSPEVHGTDPRLVRLIERSLDDLSGLLLADPQDPVDRFLAAGAPWYLTLFGRDSLWAARMMLALGTEVAAGTLRTLARRQGSHHASATEEQPGKIPHEVRRTATTFSGDLALPALYYGTIDATMLFITLLAEAWRWGMPEEEVAALIPSLERALDWVADCADADGDGFVEYARAHETGLANQGWKDSRDAVQFSTAQLAHPPIALAEVQGYAHQAALDGAALLAAFGRPGADRWREWADALARRFRSAFWLDDVDGPYVAVALDGRKRPVDVMTSNPGHLLGTGILSAEECGLVADRLSRPDMNSGWGLRTMSDRALGFNPLGYHTGSVWAHDTAIAIAGLAGTGHHRAAASLIDGLLEAASAFDYRLPELYSGSPRRPGGRPAPYPASCRPQAWSAATGVSVLTSVLGLYPDLPAGRVALRPLASSLGWVEVSGIRLGAASVSVRVDGRGHGSLRGLPPATRLEI